MADQEMKFTRASRDSDARAKTERPKQWMPPELLPSPNPEPGYAFRWIRVSTLGASDPMNVSSKLREGWEPVKASEHPEIQLMGTGQGRFPDSIEIGGLILCKTPVELTEQRNAYYQQQAEGQMQSVDNNFMRENDPRMPLFKERRSEVKFGRGS
jgi:hypothetical protein